MRQAERIPGVPVPVMPRPHLVAMKLLATGHKDAADVEGLMGIMTDEERETARALARRIGRDRKLERILSPPAEEEKDMGGEEI